MKEDNISQLRDYNSPFCEQQYSIGLVISLCSNSNTKDGPYGGCYQIPWTDDSWESPKYHISQLDSYWKLALSDILNGHIIALLPP